jgi:hypothetical protein
MQKSQRFGGFLLFIVTVSVSAYRLFILAVINFGQRKKNNTIIIHGFIHLQSSDEFLRICRYNQVNIIHTIIQKKRSSCY